MNESLRTAWNRLSRSGRLVLCLAMSAGYIDAYGLLRFGTFVSFMSGNTTTAGQTMGSGDFSAAWPALIAIGSFVVGVILGTLLMHSGRKNARALVFGIVAGLLGLSLTLESFLDDGLQIALLAVSMGIMNTTLSQVFTEAVSLTFVTGTLNKIGGHLAQALRGEPLADAAEPGDTHVSRALVLTAIWLSFLAGAVIAGLLTPRLGPAVLLAPLLVLAVLAMLGEPGASATGGGTASFANDADSSR